MNKDKNEISKEIDEVDFYLFDLKSKFKKINPEEYYLAYSGGKDSHFLFWFIKEWLRENDFEMWLEYRNIKIVSVNTYMEFPEISDRMYKNADVILYPEKAPHEVVKEYGVPCFSKMHDGMIQRYQEGSRTFSTMQYVNKTKNGGNTRFGLPKSASVPLLNNELPKISSMCCTYLKKKPSKKYEEESGRKPIMGIMAEESTLRKTNYKSCFTKGMKFTPIYDLTAGLMDKIYEKYSIELPEIYKYTSQTGCAGCPYGIGLNHTQKELELMTPAKRKYVENTFGLSYKIRGVKCEYYTDKQFEIDMAFQKSILGGSVDLNQDTEEIEIILDDSLVKDSE